MFLMTSLGFGAVLELFDRKDGLRRLFNTVSFLSWESSSFLTVGMQSLLKQIALGLSGVILLLEKE